VPFQRSDLVMRAVDLIYHVDCFRCAVCQRLLVAGDQFALTQPGDQLCCRADLDSAAADVISAAAGSCDVTTADATSGAVVDDAATSTAGVRQNNNNNNNENKTTAVTNFSGNLEFKCFFSRKWVFQGVSFVPNLLLIDKEYF